MRIIITGAGGFLGSELARKSRAEGHEVTGFGRSERPPVPGVFSEWVAGDLREAASRWRPESAHLGAAVFHLADDVRLRDQNPARPELSAGLAAAAAGLAQKCRGRLVFFSSSAVYSGPQTGYPVGRLREDSPIDPSSDYGRAKLAAEEKIRAEGCPAVILRIFSVLDTGLLDRPDRGHLIQAIHRAAHGGGKLVLRTDPEGRLPVRDYLLSSDVCRLALEAACWPMVQGEQLIVNVCSGIAATTLEIATSAQASCPGGFPIEQRPESSRENLVMVGEPYRLFALTSWRPAKIGPDFWRQIFSCAAKYKFS